MATPGYNVTQTGTALDHQVIYGRVKIAGVRAFDSATGAQNKYLHRVLMFAGHEIDAFETFYVNDEALTLDGSGEVTAPAKYVGKIRIKEHLGTSDQVADTDLVSEVSDWTADHRLRGIAYIYVRLGFDGDAFPNGVPEITALIRGKKVYDPRTTLTAWSDNSALCVRDYIASSSYGLGEASANIDDTQVTAAANVCDLTDTPDSSTRYTCNGAFTTAATPYDTFNKLLTSMGGMAWYAQGKWRMRAATWNATVLDLDEDDLRSNITIQTRHSRRDNFNIVRGKFRGSESNWQVTDYPEVSNAAFLTADGGQEAAADVDLPFTDTAAEARRIANIVLERNRQQLTVRAAFGMRAFQVQVGDNIRLTNTRFGWTNKEFEVVEWTFGLVDKYDLQVNMTLRETAESAFDDISDGVVYEQDNTTLLSPFDVPAVGVNINAQSTVIREKVLNSATIEVTSTESERVDFVEVEYKATSATDYIKLGVGEIGKFSVLDLEPGEYDFRARAINTFGVKGEYTEATAVEVDAFAGAPSDVTGFGFEATDKTLNLFWNAVTDLDLSYYRIRYTPVTSGASWEAASTAVNKVARPAVTTSLPLRKGTYMIKSYDKGGLASEGFDSVVVSSDFVPSFATTLTQTEDPTFSGTKTGVSVVSNALRLTSTVSADDEGTYDFSNYIDTGSSRLVWARIEAESARVDDTAGLFDDLPGNFDDLPGLFDSLGSSLILEDTNLEFYVSLTEDDPAGSPTWSAYQQFRAGSFYGRAFRFRVKMNTESDNITPNITSLDAIVEY